MNVTIDGALEKLVQNLLDAGRYSSPHEVIEEALKLVQAREAWTHTLRTSIQESIDEGGEYTDEEVGAYLDQVTALPEHEIDQAHA